MTPVLGSISLSLALGVAFISILLFSLFLKKSDYRFFIAGWRATVVVSALTILATLILLYELLLSNFDISYVAHYTSLETPTFYKITALWAGQSGSLLFWLFILSVYTLIVLYQYRNSYSKLMPWIIIVLVFVQIFFLILVNIVENPFMPTDADFVVINGNGLNPLLQNLTMAIHPPTLYLGYVGFTIPFAFAIAALVTKETGSVWIRSIRRWTLIAWLFQSGGIILGGWWAYQELGWGGYWAWDPVENASFMPWLTGTAFLHSIIIQEKKGLLKTWNMVLILVTFTLCIFGTFLTRSGVMSSVHAFAVSNLGPIFIVFIVIILVICIYLIISRLPYLKSEKRIESFTSRESGFLLNNVIFITICFAVFWGTIFPVLSEAVSGDKITVGAPFFNRVNIPIGLMLLFFTGVGPLLAWRRTSKDAFIRNFSIPIISGIAIFIVCLIFGIRNTTLISFPLTAFVFTAILIEFQRGINSRVTRFDESFLKALQTLIARNRSRYGGYIAHLGIVFMFIGFSGQAFDTELEFALKKGDSKIFDGYSFELVSIDPVERPNHIAWIAGINVWNLEKHLVTTLYPEKRVYFHLDPNPEKRQPHSELDIHTTIYKDIYSIFSGVDIEKQIAYLKIMINRLVYWVWFGGYVLIIGTMISLWPAKEY
jgi:cytochrome c-type biogenesis protein CcmF